MISAKSSCKMLPVFQDCVIEQNSFEFRVYLASEDEKGYQSLVYGIILNIGYERWK